MSRQTEIIINLKALKHNFQQVKTFSPNSKIIAMVKANAYGHGLRRVAKALCNTDAFGVACLEEAMVLRQEGLKNKIILMEGFFSKKEITEIQEYHCDIVLHHHEQLDLILKSRLSFPVTVWLKINTGMNRLGFSPDEVLPIYQQLIASKNIQKPIRFMTHFSDADNVKNSKTNYQIEEFNRIIAGFSGEHCLANSAGIIGFDHSHAEWVRPGIMLYGVSPFIDSTAKEFNLHPVMTLKSKLIAVRHQKKGDAIGYGSAWICPEDMLVGVVAIGYGDGYPRHAESGTPTLINNKICPIVGRVSMDMMSVDLRNCIEAKVGDLVTLWGAGIPVETIAQHASTISYDLLCGLTSRVHNVEIM